MTQVTKHVHIIEASKFFFKKYLTGAKKNKITFNIPIRKRQQIQNYLETNWMHYIVLKKKRCEDLNNKTKNLLQFI